MLSHRRHRCPILRRCRRSSPSSASGGPPCLRQRTDQDRTWPKGSVQLHFAFAATILIGIRSRLRLPQLLPIWRYGRSKTGSAEDMPAAILRSCAAISRRPSAWSIPAATFLLPSKRSRSPEVRCGSFSTDPAGFGCRSTSAWPQKRSDASWLVVCLKRCARNTPRNTSRLCNQATRQTSELST